ncbi:hypothetical protein HDK77DRAFT_427092 [Phyllosticta capitalensis]
MPFPPPTPRSPAEEEDVKHTQQQSALLNLPSEVRLLIYSHLLPRNKDISFHPITRKSSKGTPVPGYIWEPGIRGVGGLWLSILLVCRLTHDEAADILYGSNRFHFTMTSRERLWNSIHPESLNKPFARGLPINTLRVFPSSALLRMRSVSIRVEEDISRPDSYRRVQTWLADAVSRFIGEAEEAPPGCPPLAQQQHRLQDLMVTLISGEFAYRHFAPFADVYWEFNPAASSPAACSHQFVLEPLAQLRGIKSVEIHGHVLPAFAQRLSDIMMITDSTRESSMMTHEYDEHQIGDREPTPLHYDVKRLKKRRCGSGEVTPPVRTTRKFYEPVFDWGANAVHDPDAMDIDGEEEMEDPGDKFMQIGSSHTNLAPRKDSRMA